MLKEITHLRHFSTLSIIFTIQFLHLLFRNTNHLETNSWVSQNNKKYSSEYECTVRNRYCASQSALVTTFTHSRELIGRSLTEAAAGQSVRAQIFRIVFEGPIGNSQYSEVRVSSAEHIGTKRFFNTGHKMAISVQISMFKVGYFLCSSIFLSFSKFSGFNTSKPLTYTRVEFPIQLVGRLPHQLCLLPHQLYGLPHQFSMSF